MSKKAQLTPEEVSELFSEVDASGLVDPELASARSERLRHAAEVEAEGGAEALEQLARKNRKPHGKDVDPLSEDDPSGSNVGQAINRAAIVVCAAIIVIIVGMQIGYGVMRRLNTANLSENVTTETVTTALEGGVEWGNGFTQFPHEFAVDVADESAGTLEVTVVDTSSKNELDLLSNGQIQAAALATNALLNSKINRVVYNVCAYVDDSNNIQHDKFFGMLPAQGKEHAILTFVWTKPNSESSSGIDWQMRIVGMDDEITSRIQKQVNSVSSLIEDPAVSQNKIEEDRAQQLEDAKSYGSEMFKGTGASAAAADETSADEAAASAEE